MDLVKKSKYLSKLLRHKPEDAGLIMEDDGWVELAQLISNTELSLPLIDDIVGQNDKQRFEFNADKTKIRARQGHSVKVDLAYDEVQPPDVLYHGTAKSKFFFIWKDGLLKMGRQHVHLSLTEEAAIKVGQRHGEPLVLHVNTGEMYACGFKFYHTDNDVWLTDHVPYYYLFVIADGKIRMVI